MLRNSQITSEHKIKNCIEHGSYTLHMTSTCNAKLNQRKRFSLSIRLCLSILPRIVPKASWQEVRNTFYMETTPILSEYVYFGKGNSSRVVCLFFSFLFFLIQTGHHPPLPGKHCIVLEGEKKSQE